MMGFTGSINKKYADANNYLHLKKTNDSLQLANTRLYNLLKENYNLPDTTYLQAIQTLSLDTLSNLKKITYRPARVISNSVSFTSNYIVLDKGTNDGIRTGMGVITHQNAVVGIVTETTANYAVVMSLLHKDSHISGKVLKTGETGTLLWDGIEPNMVTLTNIPKSVQIKTGDTIISSGFSAVLPKGKLIGRVAQIKKDTEHNTLKVLCRTLANFHSLDYVLVIENADAENINSLLEKTKAQN